VQVTARQTSKQQRYLLYASQNYCFPILRPIHDAILERGDRVAWFTHGEADPQQYLKATDHRCPTVDAVHEYNPYAVITPDNALPHFFPGIKVQVFHGFNARKRSRGELDSHFAIRGLFDLYCTQGPGTTEIFQRLSEELGHFRVVETGWPKMDGLFRLKLRETKPVKTNSVEVKLRELSPENVNRGKETRQRPTIILTSTFTRKLTCAPHLLPIVKQLIANDTMDWLVQFHPKMAVSTIADYKSIQAQNYRFIETSDVLPYLQQADVMVSDTSSILQEFLQLERPVITLRNRTPGPWLIDIQDPSDLETAIQLALARPPQLIDEIRQYNVELHPYTDGQSSVRVLHAIENFSYSDPKRLKSKPLNLIRKFKLRKELSYWRFGSA
jgi:CDP-glycerol glycerophosphotransferase (TagB/SpsB family)